MYASIRPDILKSEYSAGVTLSRHRITGHKNLLTGATASSWSRGNDREQALVTPSAASISVLHELDDLSRAQ